MTSTLCWALGGNRAHREAARWAVGTGTPQSPGARLDPFPGHQDPLEGWSPVVTGADPWWDMF